MSSAAQTRCESFPWTIEVDWFGIEGIHPIDTERLTKITLVVDTRGGQMRRAGEYTGFRVTIIGKHSGEIATTTLFFADAMDPVSYGQPPQKLDPVIRAEPDWRWRQHRDVPEPDTTGMVAAVERFIDHWR
jgi:hypothetical protein